jgi:hypothetical protein
MAPVPTPMEANKALVKRDGPHDTDLASLYATNIRSLIYAAIGRRPDIAFVAQILANLPVIRVQNTGRQSNEYSVTYLVLAATN